MIECMYKYIFNCSQIGYRVQKIKTQWNTMNSENITKKHTLNITYDSNVQRFAHYVHRAVKKQRGPNHESCGIPPLTCNQLECWRVVIFIEGKKRTILWADEVPSGHTAFAAADCGWRVKRLLKINQQSSNSSTWPRAVCHSWIFTVSNGSW